MPPRESPKALPYGRDEVVEALLDAAEQEFGERGPDSVSVREVAERAGVKHSLIFRHIGRKEDLIRAVYQRGFERLRQAARDGGGIEALGRSLAEPCHANFWRLAARQSLDGGKQPALSSFFAELATLVRIVKERQASGEVPADADPKILSAMAITMALGWTLFGDSLRQDLRFGRRSEASLNAEVLKTWSTLLARAAALQPEVRKKTRAGAGARKGRAAGR